MKSSASLDKWFNNEEFGRALALNNDVAAVAVYSAATVGVFPSVRAKKARHWSVIGAEADR